MKSIRILSIPVLFIWIFLSFSVNGITSDSDYTFGSLIQKIMKWGSEAHTYTDYKFTKTWTELTDSIIGSTISFRRLVLKARDIKVNNGKVNVTFPFRRIILNDPNHVYSTYSYENLFPLGDTNIIASNHEMGSLYSIDLKITDTSDRLAMEVEGTKLIDAIGRISSLEFKAVHGGSAFIDMNVELTSWSFSK